MKIIFVISSLHSGGAERVLSVLANNLAIENEVVIITKSKLQTDFYAIDERVKRISISLESSSKGNKFKLANDVAQTVRKIYLELKQEKPDLVVSFISKINVMTIMAAKLARYPVIVSETSNPYSDIKGFFRLGRMLLYPFADYVVSPTKGVDSYFKNIVKVSKRTVIANPLDKIFFHDFNLIKENKIIFIGRFSPVKRLGFFIDSISIISDKLREKNWHVEIYGGGANSAEQELKSQVARHKIDDIVFLKGKTNDPATVMRTSKLLALTSQRESFGNVLIEAMACGCVPVSTDCDYGPREIISLNRNGILTSDCRDDFAKAILRLVEDPATLNSLKSEALKINIKYHIRRISDQWESIFKEVLKKCVE
jgi:GalNAc-alpha-(1->4)-GalNAc-alpha-(1->3)-diNAcBac-PP-undecaprenol alpha-1,4-N-acetyl-D-galactosaminyltransferase